MSAERTQALIDIIRSGHHPTLDRNGQPRDAVETPTEDTSTADALVQPIVMLETSNDGGDMPLNISTPVSIPEQSSNNNRLDTLQTALGLGADVIGAASGIGAVGVALVILTAPALPAAAVIGAGTLAVIGVFNTLNSAISFSNALSSRDRRLRGPGEAVASVFGPQHEPAGRAFDQFGTINGLFRQGVRNIPDIIQFVDSTLDSGSAFNNRNDGD